MSSYSSAARVAVLIADVAITRDASHQRQKMDSAFTGEMLR